jgi:hypothetical protein
MLELPLASAPTVRSSCGPTTPAPATRAWRLGGDRRLARRRAEGAVRRRVAHNQQSGRGHRPSRGPAIAAGGQPRLHHSPLMLDSMTRRIAGWTRKGWKSAAGAPVKNHDLPRAVDAELAVAAAVDTAAA